MSSPQLHRDQFVSVFHQYGTTKQLVGSELERHLLRADGSVVPYFGTAENPHGVQWLLETIAADGTGWEPYFEGPNLIALLRGGASITLEPGSQFELSTAPYETVSEVNAEAEAFVRMVDATVAGGPIHQVALGYTPFASMPQIPWVPKARYAIMRDYLSQTGDLAHNMMKGTCATQASYDFVDEEDCASKVRLGTLMGPLTTAMFANSPLTEGKPNGYASFRGHIWTRTDPRRTGFPQMAEGFLFDAWVDYLLDAPMMFYKRSGRDWEHANGRTFRDWMNAPTDGPTWADWELHMTSVFPEVRVKRTIEVRGADCVPLPLQMAFTSLFKVLFYSTDARLAATEVVTRFAAHGTQAERFAIACRGGLHGEVGGRKLSAWAEEIVGIAWKHANADDRRFLRALVDQVATGDSPAHAVLRAYERDPSPAGVIAANPFLR